MKYWIVIMVMTLAAVGAGDVYGTSEDFKANIYNPGTLKPVDSRLKVKVGDKAPDFTLPSVGGNPVTLSQFRGKKHVVISFVPAA